MNVLRFVVFGAILLLATEIRATSNHSYGQDEYVTISNGLSSDGKLAITANGGGELGYDNFHLYLTDAVTGKNIGPLEEIKEPLDTGAEAFAAKWSEDSKEVTIVYRVDRHAPLKAISYHITGRRAESVEGLFDVKSEDLIRYWQTNGSRNSARARVFRTPLQRDSLRAGEGKNAGTLGTENPALTPTEGSMSNSASDLTRALAADILSRELTQRPTVFAMYCREDALKQMYRDGVTSSIPGDSPPNTIVPVGGNASTFAVKGLRMVGPYIQNNLISRDEHNGYMRFDLKSPILERVQAVTGIAGGPLPGMEQVEYVTEYQLPDTMKPMSAYIYTGRKGTAIFRKYDDGWRVMENQ